MRAWEICGATCKIGCSRRNATIRSYAQSEYPGPRPHAEYSHAACHERQAPIGIASSLAEFAILAKGRSMLVISRQIRAARSLLGWEQTHLAEASGVAISTIRRIEGLNGQISAQTRTIDRLRQAFEEAGIEFIGEPEPGVKLRLQTIETQPVRGNDK